MCALQTVAFLLEDFSPASAAPHLLDRFLIGFPHNGSFLRSRLHVKAWCKQATAKDQLERRRAEFGLVLAATPAEALQNADAVVIVNEPEGEAAAEDSIRLTLEHAPARVPVFVYGLLAANAETATDLLELARQRQRLLLAGTALPHAFRLPNIDVPTGAGLREALIVVQGRFPAAEFNALEGLLPLLERRHGGEAGIRQIQPWPAGQLWQTIHEKHWTRPLLAAAVSRSQTPQGHPALDGRTEDLVGLGLLPTLAPQARGWLLQHADGLRSALLVLDGVVADFNFALRPKRGEILSAQLFRPPPPQQEHFSRLTAVLMDCFASGRPPWNVQRAVIEAGIIAQMSAARTRPSNGRS